jgi:hypothetical protein
MWKTTASGYMDGENITASVARITPGHTQWWKQLCLYSLATFETTVEHLQHKKGWIEAH